MLGGGSSGEGPLGAASRLPPPSPAPRAQGRPKRPRPRGVRPPGPPHFGSQAALQNFAAPPAGAFQPLACAAASTLEVLGALDAALAAAAGHGERAPLLAASVQPLYIEQDLRSASAWSTPSVSRTVVPMVPPALGCQLVCASIVSPAAPSRHGGAGAPARGGALGAVTPPPGRGAQPEELRRRRPAAQAPGLALWGRAGGPARRGAGHAFGRRRLRRGSG
ncbi:unnamed protein product, partial [Prorocentrum cordatum]